MQHKIGATPSCTLRAHSHSSAHFRAAAGLWSTQYYQVKPRLFVIAHWSNLTAITNTLRVWLKLEPAKICIRDLSEFGSQSNPLGITRIKGLKPSEAYDGSIENEDYKAIETWSADHRMTSQELKTKILLESSAIASASFASWIIILS